MSDEAPADSPKRSNPAVEFVAALAPVSVFAGLAVFLLLHFAASLAVQDKQSVLIAFAILAGILILSFAAGYAVRFLIYGVDLRSKTSGSQSDALRDRLARQVVTFGSFGIGAIALALIIAVAWQDSKNVGQTGLNVFTSILPVFSTWVGTVLAFYFSNESFRVAAESSQGFRRDADTSLITRPGTMVPYDRVVRRELTTDEMGKASNNSVTAAESLSLKEIRGLFKPPGIVRVVIFDTKKTPVYVIRSDLMPGEDKDEAKEQARTLKEYLDADTNRDKALNFAWTGKMATIDDGRRLLEIRRVTDLFVTEHGRSDEQVLGWVPDESLKKVGT